MNIFNIIYEVRKNVHETRTNIGKYQVCVKIYHFSFTRLVGKVRRHAKLLQPNCYCCFRIDKYILLRLETTVHYCTLQY